MTRRPANLSTSGTTPADVGFFMRVKKRSVSCVEVVDECTFTLRHVR
jgi:hypothetical protein